MLNTVTNGASSLQLGWRLKTLVKRLSEGWCITATSSAAGQLLSISVLTESGAFHSALSEDELNVLVENDLVEGHELNGKRYMNVMSYGLKNVA
jgi:hypothetical protein